ncbi:167L [Invertebrate iridescent virus Kaz2018]|uniref:167L n=1 Tax=Invertebrate iridescent virus 6 TaxID=176652 RepID=Q91FZ2_IIV6|nr:167L [Invertebrate iridescent virus 6]AAK82040.1 167L [Invertebrate iridescent virus 6]QMS79585.1 hypothetical protein IIV6-T1_167 [Invertebrate iridescent virus 6]QNH08577.1 167L [Invertebrate iridescent virus Kaz2018]
MQNPNLRHNLNEQLLSYFQKEKMHEPIFSLFHQNPNHHCVYL